MSESTNYNAKRCWTCKKALLDEKLPYCMRCRLTGKKVLKIAAPFVGAAGAGAGYLAYTNRINSDNSIQNDNHNEVRN